MFVENQHANNREESGKLPTSAAMDRLLPPS